MIRGRFRRRDIIVADLVGALAEVSDVVSRPEIDAAFEAGIVALAIIDPADVARLFAYTRTVRGYDPDAWIRVYRRQYAEHENPTPPAAGPLSGRRAQTASPATIRHESSKPFVYTKPKLGRNDPCWCGSGKKYKKCHLLLE